VTVLSIFQFSYYDNRCIASMDGCLLLTVCYLHYCALGGARHQWLQLHADTEYTLNVTLSRINRQQVNCMFTASIVPVVTVMNIFFAKTSKSVDRRV